MTVYHGCNLNCRYCYEHQANKDTDSMDFEVARNVITHFMEADNGFDNNEFQFFGGEPMIVFPLIKKIVDWFHTHSWKKGHIFFICTNGTILTEEMKEWLTQNKQCVAVGISLDGNKTAHDMGEK
ncbi:MAG: 4Fe-4S cluster-binding domain-containing protein [Acidobacteria bacterium]|nr:4Fe-4S cluster-binding domain-containing protein [Acidobacteriota bacterium]